jgi:acyl-CoA thioester hydrolase
MDIQTPFSVATDVVRPEWIDSNGHMNVGYYHVAFDTAAVPFFVWIGLTDAVRREHRSSTFALESHLTFVREVHEGDPLRFEARMIDHDAKRIHFYQEMFHGTEGWLAATYESLSIHMDMGTRRTAPMPEVLHRRIAQVMAAHRVLPRPWQVGHVIGTRPPAAGMRTG